MKNAQYLSAEELQERWQISPFDLLSMVKESKIKWFMEEDLSPLIVQLSGAGIARKYMRQAERKFLTEIFLLGNLHFLFFRITDIEAFEEKHPQYSSAGPQAEQSEAANKIIPIRTAQNITWKNIIMTARNYEMTEIKFPGGTENRRHADMGLKERGGKPGKILILFLSMALRGGELKPTTGTDDIKPTVSRLRTALRALFPDISGEPLPYIKGQWQTAFHLATDPESLIETMPDSTKESFLSHLRNN